MPEGASLRLALEFREGALHLVEEQVGQVVAEPVSDHHPKDVKVVAVLREPVRRHDPAALAQAG